MGFALPAAIGASFALSDYGADPSSRIIAVAGDGGFQMTMQEMGILPECPIPIKIIIANNRSLGMVNDMEIGKGGKYLLGDTPDFSLIAKAYNIPNSKINLDSKTESAVFEFISAPENALLEIIY